MSARSASSIAGLTVLRGSPIVRVCTTIDHSVSKAPRQSVDGIGYPRPRSIERASSVQISRFRAKEFETALTITVPGSPSASHVHRLERDLPRRRTGCSDQLHTPQICDCTSDHSSSISPEGIRQLPRLASLLCGELAINRHLVRDFTKLLACALNTYCTSLRFCIFLLFRSAPIPHAN